MVKYFKNYGDIYLFVVQMLDLIKKLLFKTKYLVHNYILVLYFSPTYLIVIPVLLLIWKSSTDYITSAAILAVSNLLRFYLPRTCLPRVSHTN